MSLLGEPSRFAFGLVKSRQLRFVKVSQVMLSRVMLWLVKSRQLGFGEFRLGQSRRVVSNHGSYGWVRYGESGLVKSSQITAVEVCLGVVESVRVSRVKSNHGS